jgi:hypothetical protein
MTVHPEVDLGLTNATLSAASPVLKYGSQRGSLS